LLLDKGKSGFNYSKPFQFFSEAVKFTNSSKVLKVAKSQKKIFELSRNIDKSSKKGDFHFYRSTWLPL